MCRQTAVLHRHHHQWTRLLIPTNTSAFLKQVRVCVIACVCFVGLSLCLRECVRHCLCACMACVSVCVWVGVCVCTAGRMVRVCARSQSRTAARLRCSEHGTRLLGCAPVRSRIDAPSDRPTCGRASSDIRAIRHRGGVVT